jgi:hypothetical protein
VVVLIVLLALAVSAAFIGIYTWMRVEWVSDVSPSLLHVAQVHLDENGCPH